MFKDVMDDLFFIVSRSPMGSSTWRLKEALALTLGRYRKNQKKTNPRNHTSSWQGRTGIHGWSLPYFISYFSPGLNG
jgi:hypothetical protein